MKKLTILLIGILASLHMACADDIITRDTNRLPEKARTTLQKHFAGIELSYIKIDNDLTKTSYEAVLSDETSIEFDKKGNWTEIDCQRSPVPCALVPEAAAKYVREHFPNESIVKIDRDRRGYSVELGNGLDLDFDAKGRFLRADD
ncbi:MAG: PepSY-like domain-containing protein [Bacteroidaceae bacterium]